MSKKLFLLELNEFNRDFLKNAADQLNLKNIQRLFSLNETQCFTRDTYESDALDPWVQWVSIHSGVPYKEHQVKHLGDVPDLKNPQIWEKLSELDFSSIVWGVLNGARRNATRCSVFVPDPWTFSEKAHPSELNGVLGLPRFMAKNRLSFLRLEFLGNFLAFIRVFLSPKMLKAIFMEAPSVLVGAVRFKCAPFVFFCLTEYLSALMLIEYRKKVRPDFTLFFVNSIAHLQHYYWTGTNYKDNPRLEYGLKYVDKLVEKVFACLESGENLVTTNGFSQDNTNQEKPWIMYRQINHEKFLAAVGVQFTQVEALMTHDAHIFFATEEACVAALKILSEVRVLQCPLFVVEASPHDKKKLFYRLQFTDQLEANACFEAMSASLPFFKFFKEVVCRTGKHNPMGTIFSKDALFQKKIENHEIYSYLLNYFHPSTQERGLRQEVEVATE